MKKTEQELKYIFINPNKEPNKKRKFEEKVINELCRAYCRKYENNFASSDMQGSRKIS